VHGAGVSVPSAAAVAAATAGLVMVLHMPKGGMFAPGWMSMTVAAGRPSIVTREIGSGLIADGASPKLHFIMPP
jgi:hypothetical protein